MIRPVLVYPNPQLRAKTVEVDAFDESLHSLVIDLCDTMKALKGAGLAATQIGDIRRVIVLKGEYVNQAEPLVLVNPVLDLGVDAVPVKEGCLSFPGVEVPVVRFASGTVTAKTPDGATVAYKADGWFAVALQHEVDHLNGKLLIDRAGPVKKDVIKRKFKKSPKWAARVDHVPEGQRGIHGQVR